jgi:hypothetical protein
MTRVLKTILFLTAAAIAASGGWTLSAAPAQAARQIGRAPAPIGTAAEKRRDDAQAIAALVKAGVPLQRDPTGRVRWIEAVKGEVTDAAMRYLPKLPALEWLEISGGTVTAAGMAHLSGCTGLRRLYVHDVQLSDDALAGLAKISRLEALSLQRTGITGKVLEHLKPAGALRV